MATVGWILLVVFVVTMTVYFIRDYRAMKARHRATRLALEHWSELDTEKDKHFFAYLHAMNDRRYAAAQWHLYIYERLEPEVNRAWKKYRNYTLH